MQMIMSEIGKKTGGGLGSKGLCGKAGLRTLESGRLVHHHQFDRIGDRPNLGLVVLVGS